MINRQVVVQEPSSVRSLFILVNLPCRGLRVVGPMNPYTVSGQHSPLDDLRSVFPKDNDRRLSLWYSQRYLCEGSKDSRGALRRKVLE